MALWRIGRASMTGLFDKVSVSPPISSNAATLRCFYSVDAHTQSLREKFMDQMSFLDINSQIGSCMPLAMMRIGTIIHNIEMRPSQGGKLVRAAGTCAKILKEPSASRFVSVRMPSGIEKPIDTRCKATIGQVSNPSHGSRKLRKAGQSRWLGRRPVVRGVAMNPVDHPHGGGEGRSKSSGNTAGPRCRHGVSLQNLDTKLVLLSARNSFRTMVSVRQIVLFFSR